MRRDPVRLSPLRRTALLLAAALHLLGAAAGPALHAWAFRAPPAEAGVRGAQLPEAPRAAHSELSCVVCRTAASVSLPVDATGAPVPCAVAPTHSPAEADLRGRSPPHALRARAPPVLS